MTNQKNLMRYLSITTLIAVGLTYLVIGFGAFTRLSDAGLGCPDWPACYGQLLVSDKGLHVKQVEKAHIEMGHRYIAGVLGLLIMAIALMSVIVATTEGIHFLILAGSLFALLIYQVLLGMWTVTLKLWPVVVTQHLIAGILILSILWLMFLCSRQKNKINTYAHFTTSFRFYSALSVIIILLQIFLGGWTSSNYAGLICHGFPACKATQLTAYDFKNAFRYITFSNMNFDGGLLSDAARMTIQVIHRWGALVVGCWLLGLIAWIQLRYRYSAPLKKISLYLIIFFCVQMVLGVLNVYLQLPIIVAVAHNIIAATLVLTLVTLNYYVSFRQVNE